MQEDSNQDEAKNYSHKMMKGSRKAKKREKNSFRLLNQLINISWFIYLYNTSEIIPCDTYAKIIIRFSEKHT